MQKKRLGLIFVLCLLLGLFSLVVGTAAADSSAAYTEIGDADALIALMGDSTMWSGNYRLTATIDLTGKTGQTPIGTSSTTPFSGIFDGNGFAVEGINLVDTSTTSTANWGFFGYVNGGEIRNLTVSGTVSTTGQRAGGLVGTVNILATIENCTNNCVVTAAKYAGGIVGYVNSGTTSGNVTISACKNNKVITATSQYAGGIVGYATRTNAAAVLLMEKCWNAADVTSGGADVGGVVGILLSSTVSDCANSGAVSGTSNIGGIVGRTAASSSIPCLISGSYNAGTTTASGTACASIVGNKHSTTLVTCENNYYTAGNEDDDGTLVEEADIADSTKYAGLSATVWCFTTTGPELAVFHNHTDADGDNICDTCGTLLACKHPTTAIRTVTPATCVAEGVGEEYCTVCNEVVNEAVALPINSSNHAGKFVWSENADGTYSYTCEGCSTVLLAGAETPFIYLDGWEKTGTTGLTEAIGSDSNTGIDTAAPVLTITEAVSRLAATGGKVYFLDRYVISGNVTLPAYAKEITFTTEEGTSTGFANTANGAILSLGGPTKFEKFIFNNAVSSTVKTLVIEGNWNDVTFGEKLTTYGNAYFVAGKQNPTGADDTVRDVKLVFTRTASQAFGTSSAVAFFNRIYLGSRGQATTSIYSVSNKTVTADFVGATATNVYAGSTSVSGGDAQMDNCTTIINASGIASIGTLRNGDANTGATAGIAYLDSLTLNLNDTSTVTAFALRNVREVEVNIPTGRTTDTMLKSTVTYPLHSCIVLTDVYLASENHNASKEAITVNYGSHAYDRILEESDFASYASVTLNLTDECTWDEGSVTAEPTLVSAGELTYTCSVCGATKTAEIPALKATLTQKSISAATNTASGESTLRFITNIELDEGVTVEKFGTYIALVELGADGTPSKSGAKVAVKEQTVTGTAPASYALDLSGIPADQTGTSVYAWSYVDVTDGVNTVRVSLAFDAATVAAVLAAQQ